MVSIEEEPWFLNICELLDGVCQKVDEKKNKEQQQLKECEERNELEYKIKLELAQNEELTKQLSELNLRRDELSRVCNGSTKPTITDNDQQRLDKAKEAYELGKELTGIRFDFSAPPDRMKGYIKNVPRRVLLPFDMDLNPDSLWELLQTTADPVWSREN